MSIDEESNDCQASSYRPPHSFSRPRKAGGDVFALVVSFVVDSMLGCAFIFTFWKNLDPVVGLVRCVGFVAIMGGVHFVGFRLWRRQNEPNRKADDADTSIWTREVPGGLFWLVSFFVAFLLFLSLVL